MNRVADLIKRQRIENGLSMRALANLSGISPSHLGRIERGERYPSANVLRKFAGPLGFDESELFVLAGFLSRDLEKEILNVQEKPTPGLDARIAQALSREPVRV
jgi:transcriptional regulator with XRE-family HTH domain